MTTTATPWCGNGDDKLYLQSGQFSATLKTSLSITGVDATPHDISWNGTDTPWIGSTDDKLYLQSGQFSATLKTSLSIGAFEGTGQGISWDGTNTPWTGSASDKLRLQSGKFSATMKTSRSIGAVEANATGISWDGTNTPWTGVTDDKLYLQSGHFSATMKTSLSTGAVDSSSGGITTNDVNSRLGVAGVSAAITGTAGDGATEAQIVAGGETIIITLTGATWVVAAGGLFDAQRQNIIDGIDSASAEAKGWDAVVKATQGVSGVVRTSDTVCTITLDAFATYNIANNETITVTVPASAMLLGVSPVVGSPTFAISATVPAMAAWFVPAMERQRSSRMIAY